MFGRVGGGVIGRGAGGSGVTTGRGAGGGGVAAAALEQEPEVGLELVLQDQKCGLEAREASLAGWLVRCFALTRS